jgi:protein-S-isoprenylcysteine O-methyltransferase Ste14
MNTPQASATKKLGLIHAIMVAILVWGGYLTLGAIRAPGNHAAWRGLIVFGCTLAFLGLWVVALAFRRGRS